MRGALRVGGGCVGDELRGGREGGAGGTPPRLGILDLPLRAGSSSASSRTRSLAVG